MYYGEFENREWQILYHVIVSCKRPIITIGFVTKLTLALEKPVCREKTRLTSPEVRAAAASKS